MTLARVRLWGRLIGAVSLAPGQAHAVFQYAPDFAASGIQVSPLVMPLGERPSSFPGLPLTTFHGLPGLLADSLPDRYGNALIDAWLARQGRAAASFDPVERLCYTGARGMGALEFEPSIGPAERRSRPVQVEALVRLANEVFQERAALGASLREPDRGEALREILRVGTSAGGARAKAVIAWNRATGEVRSGQVQADRGFEHWLLKFDGVASGGGHDLGNSQGYGAVEFAYHTMARTAGIEMAECRLLEEGGRRHFMTRRFDRGPDGGKLHMQSLCGLAHLDFNAAGAHSYEEALLVIRRLGLPMADIEEQFRRMVFNVVARNQDDHVKNIAFLMDRRGTWSLAPAFDVTWAFNPAGAWTARHQMTLNGKQDGFVRQDFEACARAASMKRGRAREILGQVRDAVACWPAVAEDVGVPERWRGPIGESLRLTI